MMAINFAEIMEYVNYSGFPSAIMFIEDTRESTIGVWSEANVVKLTELLQSDIRVINVGLDSFARDLARQGVPVIHVQWTPPARGNARLASLLSKLGT